MSNFKYNDNPEKVSKYTNPQLLHHIKKELIEAFQPHVTDLMCASIFDVKTTAIVEIHVIMADNKPDLNLIEDIHFIANAFNYKINSAKHRYRLIIKYVFPLQGLPLKNIKGF